MSRTISHYGRFAVAMSLLACLAAGCSNSSAYAPSGHDSRQALEAVLTAWQNGKSPGTIETTSPPVHVVDSAWQGGQKLDRYSILSEEDQDGVKRYNVRLSLKDPRGERNATYVVMGREPVWVYREDDYQRMLNMDNNPSPARRTARRR
jgi:hypothetical protein